MSLQRLRQVLDSVFTVQLDSSAIVVQRIQQQIDKRAQSMIRKGKTPPESKAPAIVATLATTTSIDIRPVDLLRKIGDLTTPANVNMASLSASWATRRYFWAIAQPTGGRPKFKLSQDARAMDFHQKTLLSDEFGIGFGGIVLEQLFQAGEAIDVSAALQDPQQYQNVTQTGAAQPDYLMWSNLPNSPYYVVECKGCQTRRAAAMNQIRRGLEQVPTLVFAGNRQVKTLVVATLMQASETTVYVIDPPTPPNENGDDEKSDAPYERTGKNAWRIRNAEKFANDAWALKSAKLLNWAGQFESARRVSRARRVVEATGGAPDLELLSRTVRDKTYRGRRVPLFPELGHRELTVFTGVQETILEEVREGVRHSEQEPTEWHLHNEGTTGNSNISVGSDGTCFIIEGLQQ